jgi:class 3 adenylate cyclase
MPEYPSGTVAFLFTDIEGSTKCWEGESATMLVAFERHFTVLAGAIAAQNGVLFKTIGNADQVMFPIRAVAASGRLDRSRSGADFIG